MRIRMRAALFAAMLGLGLGLASSAAAAPVYVEFSAVIRDMRPISEGAEDLAQELLDELAALGVEVGATVEGTVGYDDTAPPLSGSTGFYEASSLDFSFEVGDLDAGLAAGSILAIQLPTTGIVQLGGLLTLGGFQNQGGSVLFTGDGLADWFDGSLPSSAPDLDDLDPFDLSVYLDDDLTTYSTTFGFAPSLCVGEGELQACQTISILGEITRLETVPEPGGLGAVGLLGLTALAARRSA